MNRPSPAATRIDLEAHFVTASYVRAMEEHAGFPRYVLDERAGTRRLLYAQGVGEPLGDALRLRLLDVGEGRLAEMDAAGIAVQVLSLTAPGVEQFAPSQGTALAERCNDELAAIVQQHPQRFRGFAALAPQQPAAAARELERAIRQLGFVGWKTHSHYPDGYLDDEAYWPVLEAAARLEAPIYLHPTVPAMAPLWKYGFALAGAPFGFGLETSVCMMRLVYGGVFDRFPGLKIIVGHLGEGLPFLLQRIDFAYTRPWFDPAARPALAKKPSDYLRDNMLVTTSGNTLPAAFACTLQAMGAERMLLATDYPYEDSGECVRFLQGRQISEAERDAICFRNALRLGITAERG